ncbi:hypothetical protein MAPG_01125 [Magnaporthiopsis poae ATCC 64411]|uniref:Uncharacterized protein n=1 Tax=Magnaporthiopsis poae (strain ATCC 64411 / 73-15) TaxID=644358 RepID=A0A0C4DMW0_MAGP6|nr:hypothetical protein MAPG_01125 [Magnaporthiopsis poae ATCC 64411]
MLNQGAIGRLGAAGISVPGLGIGSGSRTSPSHDSPASASSSSPSQLGGLQGRFAKLSTSSPLSSLPSAAISTQPQPQAPPSEGTTFAQKQATLKTAADFHKDPRSVSLSDARAAASTMNNFRQRHGDQVAAGLKTANGLNQKYGVTDKVAAYSQQQGGTAAPQASADSSTAAGPQQGGASPGLGGSLASAGALAAGALAKKRPPPPPPPKRKPDVGRATVVDDEPPPIPHATRPTF